MIINNKLKAEAQDTVSYIDTVQGTIVDGNSLESIPFVNIWIEGSDQGTISDTDGNFNFKIDSSCNLIFSSIGYKTVSERVELGKLRKLKIKLLPEIFKLEEVEVKPDYSYDIEMFKKVIARKDENYNRAKKVKSYHQYNRTTAVLATDSTHIYSKLLDKDKDLLILDHENNLLNVPAYASEKHQRILVDNESTNSQTLENYTDCIFPNLKVKLENFILKKIPQEYNFYQNQIPILERGFYSPLSSNALLYYRVYLNDSVLVDDVMHYKFTFYPKNKHNTVFSGSFWVEDVSFALVSIEANISSKVNINFINNYQILQSYQKQDDGSWFYSQQNTNLSMRWFENTLFTKEDSLKPKLKEVGSMIINRDINYVISSNIQNQYSVLPNFSEFHKEDKIQFVQIKRGVQAMKSNGVVKQVDKIGNMFITGHYNVGIIDIGSIYDIYTKNYIEGDRVSIPLRTSEKLFKNFCIAGYWGYGFKNKESKYRVSAKYKLPFDNRTIITASYTDDFKESGHQPYVRFLKDNVYSIGTGNIISTISTRELNPYVYQQQKIEFVFNTDLSDNMGLYLAPYYQNSYESEFVQFKRDENRYRNFVTHGLLMNLRFSFGQEYEELFLSRIYPGDTKPVINLSLDFGEVNTPDINSRNKKIYFRSHASIKQRVNLGQAYFRYTLSGGYICGEVPYTLLEKPSSTNSLGYSRYSYNLLNFASYAHNLYANLHFSLNGGGIIFNHIPVVSALKIREMVSLKVYYGMKTNGVSDAFEVPDYYQSHMSKPYVELGVGITNIFKVFRIEYVHRLNKGNEFQSISSKSGIRMRFEACF